MDAKDDSKEEKQTNLWREFLKTAAKSGGRGLQNTGHLVVFGSENSGKSTLVSQFGKLESKFDQMKEFLMMRYAYCHLTNSESEDAYSLLNIWQISEPAHAEVLEVVIPEEDMENIAFLICLDLAHPDSVEDEFKLWMDTIANVQKTLIGRLGPSKEAEIKKKLKEHIQFYVNPGDDMPNPADDDEEDEEPAVGGDAANPTDDDKGDAANPTDDAKDDEKGGDEEEEEEESPVVVRDDPTTNLGVPVLVVANKCDAFRKHFQADADAEDHFEIMCSYIRWWCIEYGAASFSMQKGLKDQARRILSYVDHRVFGSKFDRKPNYVVKLADQAANGFLFVPSGSDAIDTVKAQNPHRDFEATQFNEFFKKDEKKKKHNEAKPKMQSDENEKFLKTMQFDLTSPDRTQGVRGGRTDNNGVDINDFFQRLLDPSQQQAANQ